MDAISQNKPEKQLHRHTGVLFEIVFLLLPHHSVVKILGLALFTNFKCKKRIEGDVIWEKTAISSCIHTSSTHGRWRFAAKAAIKE